MPLPYPYDTMGPAFIGQFFAILFISSLIGTIFAIIVYWKIFSKAGYSGAMSLLMLVPIANLIALCILAFGEWPIYRELNHLRQRVAMMDAQAQQYPPQNPPYQQSQQYPPQNLPYQEQGPQYPPQNPPYQQYR